MDISAFSGRVYVAYSTPWPVQYAGYAPAQAVTDVNFFLRYDKMEMTFNGAPTDVANLTSIDYRSIPMSIQALSNAGSVVARASGLLDGATTPKIYQALVDLTTPPVSGLSGPGGVDGGVMPALVPGEYLVYPGGGTPPPGFCRVIGPSSYPSVDPPGIPVQPYDLLDVGSYLQWLNTTFGPGTGSGTVVAGLGNGTIAAISGSFAGVGPSPTEPAQQRQSYNLAATIAPASGGTGFEITLQGSASVVGAITMAYAYQDLINPSGIYGGNAPFTLNGTLTTPVNNVYGWIGGDLFSELNIGAVGSAADVASNGSTVAMGALASSARFSQPVSGFFGTLQPGTSNFNQWAATLSLVTLDRAQMATLVLILEPASVTWRRPRPSSNGWLTDLS